MKFKTDFKRVKANAGDMDEIFKEYDDSRTLHKRSQKPNEHNLLYFGNILSGYNLLYMDPKDPQANQPDQQLFASPQVDKEDFYEDINVGKNVPHMIEYEKENVYSVSQRYSILNSAYHFSKFYEASLSTSASGNVEGITLFSKYSGTITDKLVKNHTAKTLFRVAHAEGSIGKFQLNTSVNFSTACSNGISELLEIANGGYDKDKYISFIKNFGTHFAGILHIGFRAYSEEESHATTSEELERKGWDVSAEVGGKAPKIMEGDVKAHYKTDTEESKMFKNESGQVNWHYLGVSDATVDDIKKVKTDINSAVPIRFRFFPVSYLLDAVLHENAKKVKDNLDKALLEYGVDNKVVSYNGEYVEIDTKNIPRNNGRYELSPYKSNAKKLGSFWDGGTCWIGVTGIYENSNTYYLEASEQFEDGKVAYRIRSNMAGLGESYYLSVAEYRRFYNNGFFVDHQKKADDDLSPDGLKQLWIFTRNDAEPGHYHIISLFNYPGRRAQKLYLDYLEGGGDDDWVGVYNNTGDRDNQSWKLMGYTPKKKKKDLELIR